MYWNETNSKIDTLLQQENISLQDILNEDEVLQECINDNKALINFLIKEEIITEMLNTMTNEPISSDDIMENYRHANMICEILTHNGNVFSKLIASNSKLLSILWLFLSKYNQTEADKNQESIRNESNEEDNNELSRSSDETLTQSDDSKTDTDLAYSSKQKITQQLNPLLASFFTKVFLYLFTHETEPVLQFLMSQQSPDDFVSVILKHIDASAIMDLIFKAWEHMSNPERIPMNSYDPRLHNLMIEQGFVPKLIEIFKSETMESKQLNVANLICDIIRVKRNILTIVDKDRAKILSKFDFESEKIIRSLLDNMLECKTKNSIVNGLKIIQNLLQYNIHARNIIIEQRAHFTSIKNRIAETKEIDVECETMPKFLKQNTDPLSSFENEDRFALPPNLCSPTNEQNEHIAKCVENVVNALDGHLEEFIRILLDDTKYRPLRSTAGIIQKPLGLIRLEIVHLFVALFATSNLHIMRKCYDLKVLCILTDLFFSYPLNNQLHKYYEQIIHYIFQYYHNFAFTKHFKYSNRDHPSCEDNVDEPKNDVGNDKDAGEAKISELDEFYEIFKLLVVQILSECNLISKILDHYSTEKVPMKSYEKEMILKNEKTRLIKSETNFNDVDMCDEVSHENRDKIEPNTNLENNETNCEKIAPIKLRPSYMGHLRMIANILNECCSEQLLSEEFCLDDELIAQWNEFRNGHLKKLNELIGSKILPNLQYNTVHNDLFDEIGNKIYNAYQAEVVSEQTLPDKIQLLPSSFGQNLCSSFNYGMKLENNLLDNAIDLDQFLNKTNDFAEFSKQFEYSANIPSREFNDDEDDDDDENDNPFAEIKSRKNFPTFAANVLREDFITLERINSTTSTSDDDNIDEFDDYFACTDVFSSEVSNEKKSTIGNELKNESIPWYQTSTSENNLNESNCVKFESDENWATFNDDAFLAETEKDFDPTTLAIDPESSGNNPEVTFDSLPDQIRANENDKEVDAIGSFLEENSANKEQEQKDTEKNDNDEDDDDVFVSNIQSTSSPILN